MIHAKQMKGSLNLLWMKLIKVVRKNILLTVNPLHPQLEHYWCNARWLSPSD